MKILYSTPPSYLSLADRRIESLTNINIAIAFPKQTEYGRVDGGTVLFIRYRYKVPNIKVPNHKIPNNIVPNNGFPK